MIAIRSQDKSRLIHVNNVEVDSYDVLQKHHIVTFLNGKEPFILGTYSTKRKANLVLEKIASHIHCASKISFLGIELLIKQAHQVDSTVDDIFNTINHFAKPFQMPQNDEVDQ